jgi:hypothetical protein
MYLQCLRWYDTATQEVFETEQTGENIINVFAIVTTTGLKLLKPSDYLVYNLAYQMFDVNIYSEVEALYVPTSELV